MYVLKFTPEDLEANRRGELTDAQQKRLDEQIDMLQRHNKWMIRFFGAMFLVMMGIGMVMTFNEAGLDGNPALTNSDLTGLGVMVVLLIFMFAVVIGGTWWGMRGLTHGAVRSVEGTAKVISTYTTVRGMRVPMHRLKLRRNLFRTFTIYFQDAGSLKHFKHGTRYRLYYLAYGMPYALSAEEITEEKAKRD
jgi:hypothetical protein